MSIVAGSMLPSAQRSVPLIRRTDLRVERIQYQLTGSWVVKDPVTLRYYRLQPEQHRVLELLDGQRSLEQIRDEFHREFPTANLSLEEIQNLVTDLHRSGLVYSNRLGQGAALLKHSREEKRKKILAALKNILYPRTPGWDPEKALKFLHPWFLWLYTPFGMCFFIAALLSSATLLTVQFDTFQSRLPEFRQFFGWPNLIYMWIVLGAAKIIHEFGHGLSCHHYGGECHEMGLMFLVLSPCLYCDVTDSWLLKNKWQRIVIGAAGMYIEILLSSLAVFGWWFSRPGVFNYMCLNLFFVSTVTTVIFNANPLMRYDGYYMLSDFLEIPNLRPKADRMLREAFAWYCLGIEAKHDPFMPQTGKGWFILFAVSAALYRWMVTFTIFFFFYTFLKPYGLQSIGIALAVFSVAGIVGNLGYVVYQIVSAPRIEPMSTRKITGSLLILATLLIAALLIPIPWSIGEPLVIEPHGVQHVYAITPGRVQSVKVAPGECVRKGQVLAKLINFEKEQEYRRLQKEADVQRVEIQMQRVLDDFAREKLAQEKLQTLELQMEDYREQLSRLTLVAPCSGTVIVPPRTTEPKLDKNHTKLPRWHGTPLDPRNLHCYLEPRTHVLSIAPDSQYQAVLLIDQAERNDVFVGQVVRVKLDSIPDETYEGTLSELSGREVEFAPSALSNKAGGDLATVTDAQGREKLTSVAYQATVVLEKDAHLLKSGLRGRARFVVAQRSAAEWLWRYLRRTFNFRL